MFIYLVFNVKLIFKRVARSAVHSFSRSIHVVLETTTSSGEVPSTIAKARSHVRCSATNGCSSPRARTPYTFLALILQLWPPLCLDMS